MRFLILLTPDENWRDDVHFHNQPYMPEHAVYVQGFFNKGNVILAGPFGDLSGGAIVVDFEREEEVMMFVKNDPTVMKGIFTYEVKRWGEGMSKFEHKNPDFGQEYLDFKHRRQKELGISEETFQSLHLRHSKI
ncbi:YciI family protein [Rossellomorea aquimaris]|uniref:YciI family protein n=1 Tax=Rossellomorea aquimaris TaxID=189382 RepID=UPI001CD6180B|nr:YciI family protein [Rossellomorea aquimaris]MCA1054122.1 YciI family protein [Rossellomorea aquimaris]